MKNSAHARFSGFSRRTKKILTTSLVAGVLGWSPAFAENVQQARVTRIVKDVQLVGGNAAARPATLTDTIRPGNGVRTGTDSRAELTFQDLSITRLGANTVFSFNGAGRTVDLGSGAVLVEAPPNSAAIHVNTAAFSAAISGGTGLLEFHPQGISKVMIMEGHGQVTPNGGTAGGVITIPAGEMATLGPDGKWTTGQKFDVALVMKSSNLITDFGTLPNEPLIFEVIDQQKNDFGGTTNNGPPHDTTLDATVDRDDAAPPDQGPGGGPTPNPTPPGPVITSPNPYVVSSATTIVTDPTITTNGQTNDGLIYRGAALDGPLSAFAFGSTSSFDTTSGFDLVLDGANGGVGFKFTALQITGNPTVDITNGPDSVALIAINGITSAGPGGNITFANARGVLLAAQNGSVTLGSELSFSGMHDLTIYARGEASDLTLGSNLSPAEHANLLAQRDMSISSTINSGQIYFFSGRDMKIQGVDTIQASSMLVSALGNLTWGGETSDETADHGNGEVNINAGGDISVAGDFSFTRVSSGSDGMNLALSSGGNTTVGGILNLVIDNSNGGSLDTGGNISLSINGNLTVNGSAGMTANVLNNNGGHIGDGGNISLNVGGDFKAEGLSASINTRDGGTTDHGVTLGVAVRGALNLDFGSQLEISTRADTTSNGGVIGGDALLTVSAGSVSGASSNAIWEITNGDNGHIQGNATVSVNVAGNVGLALGGLFQIENNSVFTLQGGLLDGDAAIDFSAGNVSMGDGSLTFQILNQGNGDGGPGAIGGSATISIHAANLASASSDQGDIVALINNRSGGTIANNAAINLTATGAVGSTVASSVAFTISNVSFASIGGDASITAQMASLASESTAAFQILNGDGGFINGDASVSVTVTGANGITLPSEADFTIANTGLTSIQPSIHPSIQPNEVSFGIGGDASVALNITHGGFQNDDGLAVTIVNVGNNIGGNTSVNLSAAGEIQTLNSISFVNSEILNSGGSIGGAAGVSVAAGSVSTNSFLTEIDNTSGFVDGAATIAVNVDGDVNVTGTTGVLLQILNEGGQIGAGAAGNGISYTVGGTTTTTALQLYVDNANGGLIANGGNLNLHTTGPVVLDGPLGMEVDNYGDSTITTGGNVTAHFEGNVSDTAGSMHSMNFFVINGGDTYFVGALAGGTIGTGGNIDVTFDGNAITTPTATTGSWGAEIANDGGSIGTGGDITVDIGGNVSARVFSVTTSNQGGGSISNGGNIDVTVGGSVTTTAFSNFEVFNNGGTIGNDPTIDVHAGSFNVGGALIADVDNETGSIDGGEGSGVVTLKSDGGITVGQGMWVDGQVTAGGDVNAGTMGSTDVTTTGNINAGAGGIVPFRFVDGNNSVPDVEASLTATKITSQGGINYNGQDSDGESIDASNGHALSLNAGSLSFGTDIVGSVTLNGGAGVASFGPGDGGRLAVSTGGIIDVSSDIEATTGFQDSSASPAGVGGTVTLTSTGDTVTVNNRIEVSSDDPTPSDTPPPPIRRSNQGGSISIQSGKASGTAIQINSSAQLLALLDNAATGPGGVITVKATGNSSAVKVAGQVEADRGTIDVEQTGPNGSITLGNTTADGTALTMRADVIKVGALGTNGILTIGKSSLTADTLIALYAGSSNGKVEFNASVTLSSATTKIIAANTVTIDNGVTVTIVGAAADVYAHTANYDVAHGGNGSTTGAFSGSVNTHIDGTPPPFGQTSAIAQNNAASHQPSSRQASSANTARSGAAPAATSLTNRAPRTAPMTGSPIGILH